MAIIYTEKDSLGFIIYRADLKLKNYFHRKVKPFGITREQWMILGRLFEEDGISQKDLSEKTLKDQAASTRTLDGMEKRGLIKRQVRPNDRRSFLIYLTDAGQTLRNQIESIAVECLEEAVKGFTKEEVGTLKKLLRRLTSNLE